MVEEIYKVYLIVVKYIHLRILNPLIQSILKYLIDTLLSSLENHLFIPYAICFFLLHCSFYFHSQINKMDDIQKNKINKIDFFSFLIFKGRIDNDVDVYVVWSYAASSYDDRLVLVHQVLDHLVGVEYCMLREEFFPSLNSK